MANDSKTALITGGTRGIGLVTAQKLVKQGYRVVLTGRAQSGCDDAARAIASAEAGAQVEGMALDLASLESVRRFAETFLAKGWPLHLLVNNAGQMSLDKTLHLTRDGIESTLATNVIGPFLLTHLLLDRLLASAPARIVNVASRVHMPGSGMGAEVNWDWDNLRGEKSFDPVRFYKNSKLATMWFTYELDRRRSGRGITVNAVCPGFVPETLSEHRKGLSQLFYKHVMTHFPGARTVMQAADNTVFAATHPTYATRSGIFIGEEQEIRSSAESYDEAQARRFWKLASELACPAPAA